MGGLISERGPVGDPDQVCDVVVVGSGAAGLSAAVTGAYHGLDVVVVDKAARLGGATAWSGGWMFVPGNPFALADGVTDGTEGARLYLRHRLGEHFEAERVEAFLQQAPPMVSFFANRTSLAFVAGRWIADIHGGTPGAGTGPRSVGPAPVAKSRLSPAVRRLLPRQLYETSFLGMGIMAGPDLQHFLKAAQLQPKGFAHAAGRVGRHLVDLATRGEGQHLVNGLALVARLAQSGHDLGVRFHPRTPAVSLVRDGRRVVGVIVEGPQGTRFIRARKAVVLAAGGFPAESLRRTRLFPRELGREHLTLAPKTTTGDGLRMGEWAGGFVDTSLASPVAWCPVSEIRYASGRVGLFPHIMDRAKPGCIAVLSTGRRFVNEADGYHDVVAAMVRASPPGEPVQSWLIADRRFQRRYPLGMAKPFPVPTRPYLRNGYLVEAPTLSELARRAGIDPGGLNATVVSFNEAARRGEDPEFGRGATPFNRYSGDPDHSPNPSLAPVEHPPFYAVRVLPGSFGTFMGLKTDSCARVLDSDQRPVPGLYAAGTDQASVFGGHYPSGGINIGPAMVFGYVAARDIAGVRVPEVSMDEAIRRARGTR